ncbi:hypothetical protein [Alicycliphilus denitrificans]|uniref:hypothetical protein n=1 Tax=Alicycliphilus denitrificans TaxID=179636 RepID=UPI00384BEC6D
MKQVQIPSASNGTVQYGALAAACGEQLEMQILKSGGGYYLGTYSENGPFTRESVQYWPTPEKAQKAWDAGLWTQRTHL